MTSQKTFRGNIVIPKEVKKEIDFMHTKYPDKEWSGVLVFIPQKGDFKNLKDFEFLVLGVYPMDLGNKASTEFDYDNALIDIHNIFEEKGYQMENIKTGLIHSHHNMSSYFSGTDLKELRDNASKMNYYVSLVVSTDEEYAAKIAIPSEVTSKEIHKIYDDDGEAHEFEIESFKSSVLDLDLIPNIEEEELMPEWFKDRYEELKHAKELKRVKNKPGPANNYWEKTGYDPYPTKKPATSAPYSKTSYPSSRSYSESPTTTPEKAPITTETDFQKRIEAKTEDFTREVLNDLTNGVSQTLKGAVEHAASVAPDFTELDKFDIVFNKLYICHFGGKASNSDEHLLIVITALELINHYAPYNNQEDSSLEIIKDKLYDEYTATEF